MDGVLSWWFKLLASTCCRQRLAGFINHLSNFEDGAACSKDKYWKERAAKSRQTQSVVLSTRSRAVLCRCLCPLPSPPQAGFLTTVACTVLNKDHKCLTSWWPQARLLNPSVPYCGAQNAFCLLCFLRTALDSGQTSGRIQTVVNSLLFPLNDKR